MLASRWRHCFLAQRLLASKQKTSKLPLQRELSETIVLKFSKKEVGYADSCYFHSCQMISASVEWCKNVKKDLPIEKQKTWLGAARRWTEGSQLWEQECTSSLSVQQKPIGSLFHWTHMHSLVNVELTIIPRVRVGYEITVDSQQGA